MKKKEFELKDIFETQPFRGGLQVPTGALMKSDELEEGSTPRITVTSDNNGIGGYYKDVDNKNYRVFENCISVSFLGTVFYHPYRASFDMKVHCLKPLNHELVETEALYIIPALRKQLAGNDYFTQTTSTDLPYMTISLPVIESSDPNHAYTIDDIDWQYMQDRIAELEQDRIAELEAYLAATGLDDYELTDEDKAVLCGVAKMRKEFKVKDVLPPIKVTKYAKKPESEGNVPFVSCQTTNNGIAIYCGEESEVPHCITVSTNGNCFDCFWHGEPIIPSSDVEVLSKGGITDNERISLYLCGLLAPNTVLYSYVNKPKNGKVFETIISLPVIASPDPNHTYTIDDIDFDYMEQYIRAMEKLAIADVVKYTDKVIATTKEVVTQQ